jgi:hypothetical protein
VRGARVHASVSGSSHAEAWTTPARTSSGRPDTTPWFSGGSVAGSTMVSGGMIVICARSSNVRASLITPDRLSSAVWPQGTSSPTARPRGR